MVVVEMSIDLFKGLSQVTALLMIKEGNSDEIYDLYNEKLANGHKEIRPLEKFIRALKDFTYRNCCFS